jgi:serine/threonine-protein kinase
MEFVEGDPIGVWCDRRQLDVRARVALVISICDAVQYAHRNLIVHRDIKPSNILVGADGQPKLLDFGIAKPLDDGVAANETATTLHPMTREYAAPEQVLGEPITTATDVYALGVLFYELLTGHKPYPSAEAGTTSWAKAIVEQIPEPLSRALRRPFNSQASIPAPEEIARRRSTTLSRLRRKLRGDLEQIVQRALEKAPEARYPTVGALSDDLRSHLDGHALAGDSQRYRVFKFLRLHRVAVAAAMLVVLLAAAGVAGIVYQARETARQAQTTAAVKDFLLGLFNASSPDEAKGKPMEVRELLDRGASRIELGLDDQPALKAELESVLGRIYFQLGLYDQAHTLQQRALDALRKTAPDSPASGIAMRQLSETLAKRGEWDPADALARDAGDLLQKTGNTNEYVRALIARSSIEERRGNAPVAREYAERAVDAARTPQVDRVVLADALGALGMVAWDQRDLHGVETLYREALSIHRSAFGDTDLRVATDRQSLTLALRNLGRYDEALENAQANVDIREKLLGPMHPDVSHALTTLGTTLYHMARYEEAERALRRALEIARHTFGENSQSTSAALNNLGLPLMDWHGLDEAEQVYAEALRINTTEFGPNHASTLTNASNLAYVHGRQGKLELAERELEDVLERERATDFKDKVFELNRLGDIRRQRGDWQSAIALHREALDEVRAMFAPNTRQAALSHYFLGLALAAGGEDVEAEAELRASLDAFRALMPPDGAHPFAASTRLALGELLVKRNAGSSEGLRLLREAVELRAHFLGGEDARTREAQQALAKAEMASRLPAR